MKTLPTPGEFERLVTEAAAITAEYYRNEYEQLINLPEPLQAGVRLRVAFLKYLCASATSAEHLKDQSK